jgi:hypothetical protein
MRLLSWKYNRVILTAEYHRIFVLNDLCLWDLERFCFQNMSFRMAKYDKDNNRKWIPWNYQNVRCQVKLQCYIYILQCVILNTWTSEFLAYKIILHTTGSEYNASSYLRMQSFHSHCWITSYCFAHWFVPMGPRTLFFSEHEFQDGDIW